MDKRYRIKKSYEIEAVIKKKKFVSTDNFVAYKKEKTEANNFRYAISVGKKIGNAVRRNKVKRQLKSIIDKIFIPTLVIDVFIVAKKSVNLLSYQEMQNEIEHLFKKLDVQIKEKNSEKFF